MDLNLLLYCQVIFWASSTIIIGDAAGPENKVVIAGTQTTYLLCSNSVANLSQFSWNFTPVNSSNISVITTGCQRPPSLSYGASSSSSNSCNLIIYNVSPDLAGTYTCVLQGVGNKSAELVVLESNGSPRCGTNLTGEAVEGETVQFSCGARYYGNIRPTVSWYNSQQQQLVPTLQELSNCNSSNCNYVAGIYNLQAMQLKVPSYTCLISAAVGPQNLTNYGNDSDSIICNTTSVLTQYKPTFARLQKYTCATYNSTMECGSDGYPNTTLEWTLPNGSVRYGSEILATQNGTYKCKASNFLGSVTVSVQVTLQQPDACNPSNSGSRGPIFISTGDSKMLGLIIGVIIRWRLL